MKNLAAFTAPEGAYPPYVSVNMTADLALVKFTVRSPGTPRTIERDGVPVDVIGEGPTAEVCLTMKEFVALTDQLADSLEAILAARSAKTARLMGSDESY